MLNLFFWGAGYLYNGKRMKLGIGLFVAGVINIASSFVFLYDPAAKLINDSVVVALPWYHPIVLITLSEMVVAFMLAYDAYKEAEGK